MKQETLEEVAERLYPENWESIMDGQHDSNSYQRNAFIKGAKWQQERSYSEEDMRECWMACLGFNKPEKFNSRVKFEKWFKQFKKK